MDIHECMNKLLKRYPEDPDLKALEKFLNTPNSNEELSIVRIRVMIDDAIARHEANKCHGWGWKYNPDTWTSPYTHPIIWATDRSSDPASNSTAGKKVSHSSTGKYYISL